MLPFAQDETNTNTQSFHMFAGAELFFFLTIWCIIVVLPTNLSVSFVTLTKAQDTSAAQELVMCRC